MSRPVIGIIGNAHLINDQYPAQAVGEMNLTSVAAVSGALPVVIPADPDLSPLGEIMELCDGFIFSGGRPNVHPDEYGETATEAHGAFDRKRDQIALPLIRALIDRGQPLLAICRGFQELNVALGGTLYPEIRDLPGRENHRMPPDGTLEEKFALRHEVTFTEGGVFHRLMGQQVVMTNTLHGQGIKTPGARILVDGLAPDGTQEAFYVKDAPGFALGVQWHPEWQADLDPVSRPLFEAFGEAAQAWRSGRAGLRKIA